MKSLRRHRAAPQEGAVSCLHFRVAVAALVRVLDFAHLRR